MTCSSVSEKGTTGCGHRQSCCDLLPVVRETDQWQWRLLPVVRETDQWQWRLLRVVRETDQWQWRLLTVVSCEFLLPFVRTKDHWLCDTAMCGAKWLCDVFALCGFSTITFLFSKLVFRYRWATVVSISNVYIIETCIATCGLNCLLKTRKKAAVNGLHSGKQLLPPTMSVVRSDCNKSSPVHSLTSCPHLCLSSTVTMVTLVQSCPLPDQLPPSLSVFHSDLSL